MFVQSRGDHDNESQSESINPSDVNPYHNQSPEGRRLHVDYDELEVRKASRGHKIDESADRDLKSHKGKSIQYTSPSKEHITVVNQNSFQRFGSSAKQACLVQNSSCPLSVYEM